jgi:putative DNA primase/helicase
MGAAKSGGSVIKRWMPSRPIPIVAIMPDKIPRVLRRLKQWVNWKYELQPQKNGPWKWSKVPHQPNGECASHGDADTWSAFEDVVAACKTGKFDGIGFVASSRDPFVMIDLDKVRDPKTNDIKPWAAEIINAALKDKAYVESSPSGTGFHIIGEGPQGFLGRKANDVEMYSSERFFTITHGLRFDPKQRKLGKLDLTIKLVSTRIGIPKPVHTTTKPPATGPIVGVRPYIDSWTDADILKLAFKKKNGDKLKRLLSGDISDYGNDASAADMGAATILGFWFWLDADAVARVMEDSELYRPKWDSKRGKITYLQYTINAALRDKTDYFGKPRRLPSMADIAMRRSACREARP